MAKHANYGTRLRLGMLLPSVNTIAEPLFHAMLPDGVSLHTTRLKLTGGSDVQLRAMIDGVEEAAGLLADAGAELILFHCTAVSMFAPGLMQDLEKRLHRATHRPATTTGHAALAALQAVAAKKIVVLSPVRRDSHDREVAFVRDAGVAVIGEGCMDIHEAPKLALVEPEAFHRFGLAHRSAEADAYFITCTAVRSTEMIDTLERELGRPVLTSNQAMVWHALRMAGIADHIPGYGRLLTEH